MMKFSHNLSVFAVALLIAASAPLSAADIKESTASALDWISETARSGISKAESAVDSLSENRDEIASSVQNGVDKATAWGNRSFEAMQNWWTDLKGSDAAKSAEEALDWVVEQANNGNAAAQRKLGELYLNGTGVSKDENKAREWFRKSCNNGDSSACSQYRILTTKSF